MSVRMLHIMVILCPPPPPNEYHISVYDTQTLAGRYSWSIDMSYCTYLDVTYGMYFMHITIIYIGMEKHFTSYDLYEH